MKLGVLGPIEATIHGAHIDIGGEKPQTVLLALILAEGHVVPTDRLIDLVWAEHPPAKPNVTLRSYISFLRKQLEPDRSAGERPRALITRAGGYALEIDPNNVDARRFRLLVNEARKTSGINPLTTIKLTDQALGLWRSADLKTGPMAMFANVAENLIDLRSEVHELRLRALLARGKHHEALASLRPLIEQDRYRESWWEILMIALYRGGRSAEALAEYQTIRSLLGETLGLEPGPTLQRLEHRILSNDQELLSGSNRAQYQDAQHQGAHDQDTTDGTSAIPDADSAPVGRTDEAERLLMLLGPTTKRVKLGVLTGEPGIGKSTLANYAAEEARRRGYALAWGRCHEGGQSNTHWPWVTILRDLLQSLDEAERQQVLGPRAVDLAPLLPSQDQDALDPRSTAVSDPVALYDAVCQALIRRSLSEPLLLVFEDLHWADTETVKLISFATPILADHQITVIATWRTTEVMDDALLAALADVSRLAGPGRMAIEGLSIGAVAELYRQRRGQASPGKLAAELRERTDGNPLFVTELLRTDSDNSPVAKVPTVGEAIDRRILSLPAGTDSLLTIGALCPAGFTELLLAEISGQPPDEVLDRIEDAMGAHILEEDPESPDRFRFTHALIAEQMATRVSTRRRTILHAKIGAALIQVTRSNAQLAYHFLCGAPAGSALEGGRYALRAGLDSSALSDHSNAAHLFEQGLEALNHLPMQEENSTPSIEMRIDLTTALAQTVKHLQHYQRAHSLAQRGFELARSIHDLERMTSAALVYAGETKSNDQGIGQQWLGYWTPPGPAREMLAECLDLLNEHDPLRITALLSYASNSFDLSEDAQLTSMVDEGIRAARDSGDQVLVVDALLNKVQTLQRCLSIPERQDLLDESISLSRQTEAIGLEVSARSSNLVLALDQRSLAEANDQVVRTSALGRSTSDPMIQMMAESMAISIALLQGRFEESEDRLETALDAYASFGTAALDVFGLQLAMLYRELGRTEQLVPMLEWKLTGYPGPAFAASLAAVLAEAGRTGEARSVIDPYSTQTLVGGGEGVLQFVTPVLYSEVVDHLEDQVAATELLKALALAENRVIAMVYGSILLGSGSLALGRMATLTGLVDQAEHFLNQAKDLHQVLNAQPYQLRTYGALAVLEASRGNDRRASRHQDRATHLAGDLGMDWFVPHLDTRLARIRR